MKNCGQCVVKLLTGEISSKIPLELLVFPSFRNQNFKLIHHDEAHVIFSLFSCLKVSQRLWVTSFSLCWQKAILDSETEWAQNKKVVDLSQKDVRRAVSTCALRFTSLVCFNSGNPLCLCDKIIQDTILNVHVLNRKILKYISEKNFI